MPVRRSIKAFGFVVLAALALPSLAHSQVTTKSQNDPRPVAHAALREGQITIDGRIQQAGSDRLGFNTRGYRRKPWEKNRQ